ncbi:MAG: hypothetical protein FWE91_00340 [Defluviitaleaceae bacterium]|nr:hypothetical protein [Defluviitaleaceae bacterium]MCL2836271.1 hypothetical protein [Defluviitaleaceae bacterium]
MNINSHMDMAKYAKSLLHYTGQLDIYITRTLLPGKESDYKIIERRVKSIKFYLNEIEKLLPPDS